MEYEASPTSDDCDRENFTLFQCRRYATVDSQNAIPYRRDVFCRVGDTICHSKFGYGLVLDAVSGRITVSFDGSKKNLQASGKPRV